MTRINLVEPDQLVDEHLLAEWKELPRIFTAVKKLHEQGKTPGDVDIPEKYVLGTGHCKFFYNKLGWLVRRYIKLKDEMVKRGYNINIEMYDSIVDNVFNPSNDWPNDWYGWYTPTPDEIYLNMQRITERYYA